MEQIPAASSPISCDNCNGACCRWSINHAVTSQRELLLLRGAVILKDIPRANKLVVAIPVQCRALSKEGRCTIYPNRPQLCKNAVVGDEVCRRSRKLEGYVD